MILLKDILYRVGIEQVVGSTAVAVRGVEFDSRRVALNDVFVAIKGVLVDGHQFIKQACDQGAIAIICEQFPEMIINGITYVQVRDASAALAYIADNYYEQPAKDLVLVGVTGTNGKTTVATLLHQLFTKMGYAAGLLSTVENKIGHEIIPSTHTTPDSLTINRLLRQMVDAGLTHCFMEVSSHGIDQNRTLGLDFDGGIFTNLTHDHLDYHKDFKTYRDVKKRFFDGLKSQAFALTNQDDKNGGFMLQNTKARVQTYAQKSLADFKVQVLEQQISGQLLKIDGQEVWVKLIGGFNAYNLLAIYACGILLEVDPISVLQQISTLESVSGRFQYYVAPNGVTVIVDYAHTPDALENVLGTIAGIRTGNETLITVVGCGGDRDKTKRPKMAAVATHWSNKVIFTSDNPRSEPAEEIISQMESGVPAHDYKKFVSITDRRQAIKTAVQMAASGDLILIAGKGHETYQEISGVRHDFDDYKIASEFLNDQTA
ncbi:MAG: UDP-N-acetylmuramoyl-L-alanyl-D-glutamate--2,6-diaminopimelate ligase [Flavobacteriaceae bacterium]|nr:UDP-N-acetylmuramoyl-L-alanyl-D-glutamate--2,6-diaminopimelate ligase [Flavobacteriaceae bacterium]